MSHQNVPRRVVLITGCSSGLGRAAAMGLSGNPYRVFATVRNPADRGALEGLGIETLLLDLADSPSIHRCIAELLDKTDGKLFGLINNGAYGQPGAVEDLSREALRHQFETNLFGTHELTRACIPVFRKARCGRIIQISSVLGRICLANRGAYNASKYALEALSDTMRLELYGTGVYVSLIEPGAMTSRFRDNALKAFRQYIDADSSVHAKLYQSVINRLNSDRSAAFSLPAQAILPPIRHALESRRPRTRYPVTIPAKVLPFLKRVMTDRGMDWVARKSGDQPGK